tara:strand:- start:12269 stop:15616 length:3348 start_codon:yes stop_codon:yes gene_type:complete
MSENYEWLDPREHVLKRSDTYVGSISVTEMQGHVFIEEDDKIVCKNVKTNASPALFKLFDEVISNAIDNSKRDTSQKYIKCALTEEGVFSVSNDGQTIPIKFWENTDRYIPEILVYELMSGENFKDERINSSGRNGLGVKIVNLLSDFFEIHIINVEYGLSYYQRFEKNASIVKKPIIKKLKATDKRSSTTITFKPEYARLQMSLPLDKNVVNLIKTRAYDASACTSPSVSVYFNDMKKKLQLNTMKDYTLALGGSWIGREEIKDRNGNTNFEFSISAVRKNLDEHPKCVAFVNAIQCSQGTHVEMVYRRLIEAMTEICKKKTKKTCNIRPQQLKDMMIIVINANFQNPTFSSQTKEKLDLRVEKFGFTYSSVSPALMKQLEKSKVLEEVLSIIQEQEEKEVKKSVQQTKRQKLSIPKYQRALKSKANLYVTEGDSAMAMALSGFSVIGRDSNGVFPLRGKLLNVYGMKAKSALEHKEIMHLTQILGLEPNKQYDETNVKSLPYRHIIIFTDQDTDGSHIMGLVLTYLREFFPSLFKLWPDFVKRFATHIVKAKIGTESRSFFSLQEYKKWVGDRTPNHVKYYKGLGTSTDEEAREYFRNIDQHLTEIEYTGDNSEEAIKTFYAPDKANKRKEILQSIDAESCVDYMLPKTTMEEFCYNELIHHCAADNERSIANGIDGLKPSQRKILHTARQRKNGEVKVASLAANTTDLTAYHHGEQSLVSAIMSMAQKHVGTNNIAYLKPNGQFGSRLTKRDEGLAQPRYVFTEISDIAKKMFRAEDDAVLSYAEDDGKQIEPTYFVPVISNVLVNGCEGIGTGYKTSIPNFNPLDIIDQTVSYILHADKALEELVPYYMGFKGRVEKEGDFYIFSGLYEIKDHILTITELPPKVWSTHYFESLQKLTYDYIVDIDQQSTKEDVRIIVKCKSGTKLEDKNILEDFKLSTKIALNQMHLFDKDNVLTRYSCTSDIIKDHAKIRLDMYQKRLQYQIRKVELDVELYKNKARFLKEVSDGKLKIMNKKKEELRSELKTLHYFEHEKFNYLITMEIFNLTLDEVDKMIKLAQKMQDELDILKNTTPQQVWLRELDELKTEYQTYMYKCLNPDVKLKEKKQRTSKKN